jgi:high-affinity Fe2+/Pb2+ permease
MLLKDIPKPIVKNIKTYTRATSADGVRKNTAWIHKHHKEYRGKWIALNEGILLGANESLVSLYKAIKNSGQLSVALFMSLKMEM